MTAGRFFGVYGAGGFGREVMPLLRTEPTATPSDQFVFIDDVLAGQAVNGHDILDWAGFCSHPSAEKLVAIAVSNSGAREGIADKCRAAGVTITRVTASNVVALDEIVLGEGSVLMPFVTLSSNVRVGRHFHANYYSYVAHDCVIGDFVTFAPAVRCNGNVVIGDHAYIGSGAILRQGRPDAPLRIGAGAVIGMGAVVTKDVPAGVTVVGNPARPLVRG